MSDIRKRVLVRSFSLLAIGVVLLALWQTSALAVDGPDDPTGTTEEVVDEVSETTDAVTTEVTEATTSVTETAAEEVADAPEAAVVVEEVEEAAATTTALVLDDQPTGTEQKDAQPTSQPSSSDETGAPAADQSTESTTVAGATSEPASKGPEVKKTTVVASRSLLKKPSDKDLEWLVAAGDEVEGPVVLGERIESTSSTVDDGEPKPSTSGQLAFTGADLVPLVMLAAALLIFGSKAASTKKVAAPQPSRRSGIEVTHLRFA